MRALAARCNDYPPVARMLDGAGETLAAGLYDYYRGFGWTLIFLAEMRCHPQDERAQRLARAVLAAQLDHGGFGTSPHPRSEIVCLTANLLRALVHFGFGGEPGVRRGYRRLAERILPYGGVPCRVVDDHSMRSRCRMTIPQTLRSLAVAPDDEGGRVGETVELLTGQLREMKVYRYFRPDVGRYQKLVHLAPRGTRPPDTSVADFKAQYRAAHPLGPEDWVAKPGWLRFGFPSSYDPDLLEAALALAELGAPHHPSYDDALDVIERKRGADGRWRLEKSLDGKTIADIETKGAPSKWITLRALTVLRHFGRLDA